VVCGPFAWVGFLVYLVVGWLVLYFFWGEGRRTVWECALMGVAAVLWPFVVVYVVVDLLRYEWRLRGGLRHRSR
jgi:hypothetical protein